MRRWDRVVVCLLVSTLVLHSRSLAWFINRNGVRPSDPYVHYGENLVLWCDLTKENLDVNSSSMSFVFKNQTIPQKYVHIIDAKTIKLVYPVSLDKFPCSSNKRFNIICYARSRKTLLGNQLVQVNYAVKPISKFECRVYDWQTMTCSWDLSTPYCNYDHLNITPIYTFVIDGNDEKHDCEMTSRTSCVWNKDIFRMDSTYFIRVLVRNAKSNSSALSSTNIVRTNDIVQPAKVKNLKISTLNSTCLAASWNHTRVERKRRYKLEAVEVMSEYDEPSKVMYFYERDTYTFCGLQPYTLYTISVSNIPVQDGRQDVGFWSDTVETVIRTEEDVPIGVPGLSSGSYVDKICAGRVCGIHLFWQPINKKLRFGVIIEYKIQATSAKSRKTSIFLTSGDKISFPLDLPNRKTEAYYISISGRTSKGFSDHTDAIIIPSLETAPSKVENVVVEAVRNTGTNQYLIQWSDDEQEKVYTYTLYYCKRSDKTQDCRESLSWETLDASRREFMLELEMEDDDFTWHQTGISREEEEEGKIKSSGIVWNKCVYIKDTKPSSEPDNVRFADLQPDRALLVEWDKLDCIENKAYVTSYLIHICLIMSRNGPCVGQEENITVSNKLTKFQIENLTPSSLYQVTIQAVSRAGIGPKSLPISHHVTDSSLSTYGVVGFAIGVFIISILVLIAVWTCIGMAKKEKKKCKKLTRIKGPEFQPEDFIFSPYKKSKPSHLDVKSFTNSDSGFNGWEDMQCLLVKDRLSEESQKGTIKELEDLLDKTSDVMKSPTQEENSTSPVDSYTQFGVNENNGNTCIESHQPISLKNTLNPLPSVAFLTRGYVPNNLFTTGQLVTIDHKPSKEPYTLKQLCYEMLKLKIEYSGKKLPELNCLLISRLSNESKTHMHQTDSPKNDLTFKHTQATSNQEMETHNTALKTQGENYKTVNQIMGKVPIVNRSFDVLETKEQHSVALSKVEDGLMKNLTEIDIQFPSCPQDLNAKVSGFHSESSFNRLSPLTFSFKSESMPLIKEKTKGKIPPIKPNTTSEGDSVKTVINLNEGPNEGTSLKKEVINKSLQNNEQNKTWDSLTSDTQSNEFISKDDDSKLCDRDTDFRHSIKNPDVPLERMTSKTSDYVPLSMLMKDN